MSSLRAVRPDAGAFSAVWTRGRVVALRPSLLKKLLVTVLCAAGLVVVLFSGPATSGAILLMLPGVAPRTEHGLPPAYQPLHKGRVDLGTGLYVRENEDLVVRDTPPLILRRTYLSGYRVSKEFGIGTTHPGEVYLIGDGKTFRWVQLILAHGTRITFDRTSSGTSYSNAMYAHRSSVTEWNGAQLGWTGSNWVLRRPDSTVAYFQPCGPRVGRSCSISHERDDDGHVIHYRRDKAGRLLKMDAESGWISFEYGEEDRIVRANDSTGAEVRYDYDTRGRLSRASSGSGRFDYTYTDRDELKTMSEPGKFVENWYDGNGRVIRQVNRVEGAPVPHTFEFAYHLDGNAVVQVETKESDGSWSRYAFGKDRATTSETHGKGSQSVAFAYERDPGTNAVTSVTLTCPDRSGRPLRHFSLVRDNNQESIKRDLVETRCSLRTRRQVGAQ
jgi:YD repeat-containing protein